MINTTTYTMSQEYKDYMRLSYKLSVNPDNTLLQEQHITKYQTLIPTEQNHADWVNSLYTRGINIDEIKKHIKVLSNYQHQLKKEFKKDVESGWHGAHDRLAKDLRQQRLECKPKKGYFATDTRITQLCALRAAMRGRLHFSPTSDGVFPKTMADQRDYVEEIIHEFFTKKGK